jgi:hypothetical protein
MKDNDRKKIEEIMAGIQCPRNFKCAKGGFERLCKVEDVGLKKYLVCIDKKLSSCSFALSLGRDQWCRCPLRVYLSEKLKK